jgi:hypothetical protein
VTAQRVIGTAEPEVLSRPGHGAFRSGPAARILARMTRFSRLGRVATAAAVSAVAGIAARDAL